MLKKEQNDLVTQTGPGTPMGELMRRYWQPILLSRELPEPDGPPLRVRVLGEDLVAFRDSRGRVGLIGANCPHRGAPLVYGRNEQGGLRCIYHGWHFDIDGRCLEMPNAPAERDLRETVRVTAYPINERNGVIWGYLGAKATMSPPPDLGWTELPESHKVISKQLLECNFAQALEGDLDPSHVSFLHAPLETSAAAGYQGTAGILSDKQLSDTALEQQVKLRDKNPRINIQRTDYGLFVGACRDAGDRNYWRFTQLVLPYYVYVPGAVKSPVHCNVWQPMDDTHTIVWRIQYLIDRPFTDDERARLQTGFGAHVGPDGYLPATDDPAGAWRPKINRSNNYGQDRTVQREVSYSGIRGIWAQDRACTEGMGAIMDRTREHLVGADATVVQMRRMILSAALALRDSGTPPPGVGLAPPILEEPTVFHPKALAFDALAKDYLGARSMAAR